MIRQRYNIRRIGVLALLGLTAAVLWAWSPAGARPGRAQAATTVQIADGGDFGLILVDDRGFTLYVFDRDEPGVSNCSGRCAEVWPPLTLDDGDPTPPDNLPGALSVIMRADGGRQVAYNDRPLYTYAGDTDPGQTTGEGVGGVWHVALVMPADQPAANSAPATPSPTPTPTPTPTPPPTMAPPPPTPMPTRPPYDPPPYRY